MIKKFSMYIPLDGDTEVVPCIYEYVRNLDDEWLEYINIETHFHFNITEKCIRDFIEEGYIYDVVEE